MTTNVHETPTLPMHWVMQSVQGTYFLVPREPLGGWSAKRPYRGHVQALRPVAASIAERAIRHASAGFDFLRSDFHEYVEPTA